MKWAPTRLFAACILLVLSALSFLPQGVWATSVSCGTTITSTTVLTGDLLNCPGFGIIIGASGITLDCQNHTIGGSGSGLGILSHNLESIAIRNCVVQNFNVGIQLDTFTNQSQLASNIVEHNFIGVLLSMSNNNTLRNNLAENNGQGFSIVSSSIFNTFVGNSVRASSGPGFILLQNANYNNFTENTAENSNPGFQVGDLTNHNIYSDNLIVNSKGGFSFASSSYNIISGNIAENVSFNGFLLGFPDHSADHNILSKNIASNTTYAFSLTGSFNTLLNNTAQNSVSSSFSLNFAHSDLLKDNIATGVPAGFVGGFGLANSTDNTLVSNVAISLDNGFGFFGASNNLLANNRATNTSFAFALGANSNNNTLANNKAENTSQNAFGIDFSSAFNALDNNTSDHAGGVGFIILRGANHNLLTRNVAKYNGRQGFALFQAFNNTLTDNTALNSATQGFGLFQALGNTLTNNTALNSGNPQFGAGFGMGISSYNILVHNTSLNSTFNGFSLIGLGSGPSTRFNVFKDNLAKDNPFNGFVLNTAVSSNTFDGNLVEDNVLGGFALFNASDSNVFTRNLVTGNGVGFGLARVMGVRLGNENNTITSNIIEKNFLGIFSDQSSSNNLIYNNLFSNMINAADNGTNIWNIIRTPGMNIVGGPFLGGNFWSDYAGADLDGDGLGDTMLPYNSGGRIIHGGDFLPLVPRHLTISEFFTDPSFNTLPTDSFGNPIVAAVLAHGFVRSTIPGRVLAWVNVTNTGSLPLQSLKLNETLPLNWAVAPPWIPSVGAIHVFFANTTSLSTNPEITQRSTITVSPGSPQVVRLAIPSFNATAIGHPLMSGQSILVSVQLTYTLVGTVQSPRNYPINYTDAAIASAWTIPFFMGSASSGQFSAFFTAYAKVVS